MFNVLPENLKQKVKAEYKIRRMTVILISVLFLQMSFLVFLLPSWIISVYKEKDAISQVEDVKQSSLSKGASPIASVITDTNKKLFFINSLLTYQQVSPIIDSVLSNKTPSISLNEFSYTSGNASTSTLVLGGVSATREALVAFVKSLEKSGAFKTVDLPVSNLAKDKNIDFSINLSVVKP